MAGRLAADLGAVRGNRASIRTPRTGPTLGGTVRASGRTGVGAPVGAQVGWLSAGPAAGRGVEGERAH